MNSRRLVMHFVGEDRVELFETHFEHPLVGTERRLIRGKRSGAYRGYSTFQWTRAVQALSVLMVEARRCGAVGRGVPRLMGGKGSLASSLDYAIDKQTTWLHDMFGWDESGRGYSRRLFSRTNPGQRNMGPVAVGLNQFCLEFGDIEIMLNGALVSTAEGLGHVLVKLGHLDHETNQELASPHIKSQLKFAA